MFGLEHCQATTVDTRRLTRTLHMQQYYAQPNRFRAFARVGHGRRRTPAYTQVSPSFATRARTNWTDHNTPTTYADTGSPALSVSLFPPKSIKYLGRVCVVGIRGCKSALTRPFERSISSNMTRYYPQSTVQRGGDFGFSLTRIPTTQTPRAFSLGSARAQIIRFQNSSTYQ